MAKLSTGQKRRQKELKHRKKKQLQVKKQHASMVYTNSPSGLPKLSERLVEFAGALLDGSQTSRNYIENTITMVAACWNMGAVAEEEALDMREGLSKALSEGLPDDELRDMEQHFDILITARRFLYGDDPRFIISHDVTWTGPDDYYLQIASAILPEDERFSASLESAGAGLSATLRERIEKFQAPLTEEEAQLEELINQGLVLLHDKKTKTGIDESVAACEVWLDAWEMIKELYQDKTSLDNMDNKMGFTLDMWGSDMDMHLLNAARVESSFMEKGITFLREFLEHFPESSEDTHKFYRRAIAELQFLMGECEQGDATFEALVKDYPDSTWSYIGWGDIYNPTFSRAHSDDVIADIDRAKTLYRIPIDRELEDADHASDRLDELLTYERKETTLEA